MSPGPHRILVAVDFSAPGDEALERAIELARQSQASIDLLHVIEPGGDEFPFGFTSYGSDRAGLVAYIDRELASRAGRVQGEGVTCRTGLAEGQPAAEIVDRARDLGADLIVIGTHGRRGLSHAMLGSVAERVVRRAACPVLTVPCSNKAA
jgi:nucleotide-binding universal stress UspA family protein